MWHLPYVQVTSVRAYVKNVHTYAVRYIKMSKIQACINVNPMTNKYGNFLRYFAVEKS